MWKVKNHKQNAVAERVNGIFKDEFYLDKTFDNLQHAKRAKKMQQPTKSTRIFNL